jgi:hypothetical protein
MHPAWHVGRGAAAARVRQPTVVEYAVQRLQNKLEYTNGVA